MMKQARVLTEREIGKVFRFIEAHGRNVERNRLCVLLTHYAGLRVGELAKLKIGDVYEGDGRVRDEIRLMAGYTKGGIARSVFVGKKLNQALESFRATKGLDTDLQGHMQKPLIRSQKGQAFSANSLAQLMGRIYVEAGFAGATGHSGRRWFVTTLDDKGVGLKTIMQLVGHKNLSTTQRYLDTSPSKLKNAVQLL